MSKKVVVAMSGGVDSSVTAALLKKQGFQVSGIFMKLNNTSGDALERARQVAKVLEIPFLVLDLRKKFKKIVIDYFLKEYKQGRTPNPCVVCNKEIKFDCLFKLKADFFATGHYAKLDMRCPTGHRMSAKLLMARDKNKDQSYFLWRLNQEQLKRILFPVGDYAKLEVRTLAKKFKLPVAETPESQEICFVPNTTNGFLKKHLKSKKGKIVDTAGKALGEHQGLIFYTIGQRKGIGLSGGPYFVQGKDAEKNILVVTKNEKDLLKKELFFNEANWLSGKSPKLPMKVKAKIRSRSELVSAMVYKKNKVVFTKPQRAITPGQSIVFYHGQELLGGGTICRFPISHKIKGDIGNPDIGRL